MSETLLEALCAEEAGSLAEAADPAHEPVSAPLLPGQHCLLRPPRPQDTAALARIHADERVLRYEHDHPFDAEFWCSGEAHTRWGALAWAIVVDGSPIGMAMICPGASVFCCSAEVSYWLAPERWGRGIATEALALITGWAWSARPELSRLFATIYLPNLASQRVAAKCGYVCEAVLPQAVVKGGRPATYALYGCYRTGSADAARR
jgi:ribosomal-protein-alanine N-acetyltransferase